MSQPLFIPALIVCVVAIACQQPLLTAQHRYRTLFMAGVLIIIAAQLPLIWTTFWMVGFIDSFAFHHITLPDVLAFWLTSNLGVALAATLSQRLRGSPINLPVIALLALVLGPLLVVVGYLTILFPGVGRLS